MRGPRGSLTSSRSADTSAPSTGRTRGRYSDARTQAQCRTTISRETTEAMSTGDDSRRTRGDPRVTGRRPAPGRTEGDAGPSLPDRLVAARERKGVDLFRAERDTKIRSRYLAALERGDYRELPGAVYTKGFLRNYAVYLGLDPEEALLQWRAERGDDRPSEPVIVVPRAIQAPPRAFTFSPGIL